MQWIAPSEKDTATDTLEKRLWDAADQFRANSGLTAAQYSAPVLGLIFLRFAEVRFAERRAKLEKPQPPRAAAPAWTNQPPTMPKASSISRPTPASTTCCICPREAMSARRQRGDARHREAQPAARRRAAQDLQPLHRHAAQGTAQEGLRDSRHRRLRRLRAHLRILPRRVRPHRGAEGRRVLHARRSIVRLLVEVIEPFHGRILDPACGSGGMFVQRARFVAEHKKNPVVRALHLRRRRRPTRPAACAA